MLRGSMLLVLVGFGQFIMLCYVMRVLGDKRLQWRSLQFPNVSREN